MMNKIHTLVCAMALIAGNVLASAIGDVLLTFGTKGTDTYADGQPVLDGECYALVWTKDDCVFGGFNTDGTLVSEFDKVVVFAPVAKDGRCPATLFEIDENKAKEYQGGSYAICLLDTRISRNGLAAPAGFVNGAPRFISGYSPVIGSVKASDSFLSIREVSVSSSSSAIRTQSSAASLDSSAVRHPCADICAAVPADLDQPKITAIKVQGDMVCLTIENLPGVIGVRGSETISNFGPCDAAVDADGKTESVEIAVPVNEVGSAFFKAFRSR